MKQRLPVLAPATVCSRFPAADDAGEQTDLRLRVCDQTEQEQWHQSTDTCWCHYTIDFCLYIFRFGGTCQQDLCGCGGVAMLCFFKSFVWVETFWCVTFSQYEKLKLWVHFNWHHMKSPPPWSCQRRKLLSAAVSELISFKKKKKS